MHAYDPKVDDTHPHDWVTSGDFFVRNLEACYGCGAVRPADWPRSHVVFVDGDLFEIVTDPVGER